MGTFSVSLDVGDPAATSFRSIVALVDTGATYTTLPGAFLRSLGVAPHSQRTFVLATGDSVVREIGRAWVRIGDQTEMTIVVFGDDDSPPLLGAVTLEEMALGVDPLRRRLMPVVGLLA